MTSDTMSAQWIPWRQIAMAEKDWHADPRSRKADEAHRLLAKPIRPNTKSAPSNCWSGVESTKQFRYRHVPARSHGPTFAGMERPNGAPRSAPIPTTEAKKKEYRSFSRIGADVSCRSFQEPQKTTHRMACVAACGSNVRRWGDTARQSPIFQQARSDPKDRRAGSVGAGASFSMPAFVDEAVDTLKDFIEGY